MRNILLAISGLTPQIVTETLFALTIQKEIIIDEIYVITTRKGKTVLEGKDKGKRTPEISLASQISAFAKDYNINPPKFSSKKNVIVAEEESIKLFDIKTDKENILFPNKLAEVVKKITSDENTTLFASLSGGRKSMSAHLALVMSLFSRNRDKLYHVITEERFEFSNFYPKTKEEKKALSIAEIPFVRLRSLNEPLLNENISYSKLVHKTQKRLSVLSDPSKLIIDVKSRMIKFKNNAISLPPMEFGIYLTFCEEKIRGDYSLKISKIQSVEFAGNLLEKLIDNYNYYVDSNNKKHWAKVGITPEYFRTIRSKINSKLKKITTEDEFNEFKISTSQRIWGYSSYKISAPKNKIGINYE